MPDKGKGTTAERAEQAKTRENPRYDSEDRRVLRKITPTLPLELVERLRAICKAEGYTNPDGSGQIASPVVEDLLRVGIEAYERGELQRVEVVQIRHRLGIRKSGGAE